MVLRKTSMLLAAALSLTTAWGAQADDLSGLRNEMADMKVKMASMEGRLAAADMGTDTTMADDAAGLRSLKNNATIRIGGDVNVDLMFVSRDDNTHDGDHVDNVYFRSNSTNLRFQISPTGDPNSYLYIKLDLDDGWDDENFDAIKDQDDLLEEVKFVWNNIRGSSWGAVFGKGEVPYGQDRTLGIIQSYHHNDTIYSSEGPVFIVAGYEDATGHDVGNRSVTNPHSSPGSTAKPGEVDNVFQVGVNYVYKNLMKFEFSVFQNNHYWDLAYEDVSITGAGRGMHEDRPDDNMLFQSFAARLWFLPTETLTLQASFLKEHNDSMGDERRRAAIEGGTGSYATADQYAASIGFQYASQARPLEVFGEYQHGWDWDYTEDYHTDTLQLGFLWGINEAVKFGMMYEYLAINDEKRGDDTTEYQKFVAHLRYTFRNQMYMMLEYGYEYVDFDLGGSAADDDRNGHLVAFRTGWAF